MECYSEALKLDPKNDVILSNKGVALMELERFREAVECFRKAVLLNPTNDDAKILRDECLENL